MSYQYQAIPQTDPKANYLAHRQEIETAIRQVLESGWYVLGHEVATFEQEFAAYTNTQYASGVANGTDAIEIALRACDIGPGDSVLTVSHTAVATVAAIERTGATPIFVDIDPVTYTLDPNHLHDVLRRLAQQMAKSQQWPKAVIPVHLYGHPADMPAILEIAKAYELAIIEDCAQAHGAKIGNQPIGSWGDLAAFSFYPTKNLGALGDGGAVVTDKGIYAEKVVTLRQYGWRERYVSEISGVNSRLDELQAAVLRVKLRYLTQENQRRQELAQCYTSMLAESSLQLPQTRSDTLHVYHQYAICACKRDGLKAFLQERRIGTLVHYPVPVHLQPAYQKRIPLIAALPQTERVAKEVLSLPMYPELLYEYVQAVCEQITAWETAK